MNTLKQKCGIFILAIFLLAVFLGLFFADPIPQPQGYHHFSDQSEIISIPNALNVLSNLPFLVVGILGVVALVKNTELKIINANKIAYYALFVGSALVAFGSGYYHLWPNNQTLLWDRLPMTVAFMALFSIVITEFVSIKFGRLSFIPFILIGLSSVVYWHITEANGAGDLRPYIVVQFFPILAMPVMILCFTPSFNQSKGYWWLFFAYLIAKLLEHYDAEIHSLLGVISGHSLKHIAAAVGLFILLHSYKARIKNSE